MLILGDQSPSWFDRFTMDYARTPIIRRLQAFDTHKRLCVYTAHTLRDGLISHFLGVTDDAFVRAAKELGLGEAIDALNARRLAPLRPRSQGSWEAFVSRYRVGDPTSIDDNWQLLRRCVQAPPRRDAPNS